MRTLASLLLWISGFFGGVTVVYAMLYECRIDDLDRHFAAYAVWYCLVLLLLAIGLRLLARRRDRPA